MEVHNTVVSAASHSISITAIQFKVWNVNIPVLRVQTVHYQFAQISKSSPDTVFFEDRVT